MASNTSADAIRCELSTIWISLGGPFHGDVSVLRDSVVVVPPRTSPQDPGTLSTIDPLTTFLQTLAASQAPAIEVPPRESSPGSDQRRDPAHIVYPTAVGSSSRPLPPDPLLDTDRYPGPAPGPSETLHAHARDAYADRGALHLLSGLPSEQYVLNNTGMSASDNLLSQPFSNSVALLSEPSGGQQQRYAQSLH